MSAPRIAWLSSGAVLVGLSLASLISSAPASAAASGSTAQVLDPTLQALATDAAVAVTQIANVPTPNPTALAGALDASGAVVVHGTLTVTGDANVSGAYTTPLLNVAGIRPDLVSCAAMAQGIRNADGTGFGVPGPSTMGSVGGHSVLIPVSVSPYPGPGDYARDTGVQLGPGLVIDGTNYLATDQTADYHVRVNPDGSGSFTFTGFHAAALDTGVVSAASISGSAVWTCASQP